MRMPINQSRFGKLADKKRKENHLTNKVINFLKKKSKTRSTNRFIHLSQKIVFFETSSVKKDHLYRQIRMVTKFKKKSLK